MTEKIRPSVGIASIVWKDKSKTHLLLGLGHDPTNRDKVYVMPGGHWESSETLIEGVKREVKE